MVVAVAVGLLASAQSVTPALAADDPAVVASASNGSGVIRNSISLDRPAGTVPGHVMVASLVMSDDDPGFNAPSGWTVVRDDSIKDTLRQTVYMKVAGSSEPPSYSWGVPPGRRMAGGITTFAGIDTAQPIDASSGTTNPSGTSVSAPAITTTVPNTMLVHLAAVASDGGITAPAGMSERWEAVAPGSSTKKNKLGAVVSLAQSLQPASGATGTRTAKVTKAGKSIGVLLALRPVPGPDVVPPDTTINSGPSGTTFNAFATFTFSATEPATFACSLDGAAPEPCSSSKTYVNLTEGGHTFSVQATDTAGNADPVPATRSWTVAPYNGDPILAGAGDIAYCGNDNDEATARLLDNIPGTVFTLGDNVYDSGSLSEYNNCYGPTWGRHKSRTTPVAGNHEYVGSSGDGYYGYFGSAAGDRTKGYYDYRVGAWHVIVLNSNCADIGGCHAGSPQEQWLRGVLAQSQADCTVALLHHPRFSSSSNHGSVAAMQPFWQTLYDFGADVVLSGHDHVYERFGLQTPGGSADAVFGLREFVVGTGGRSSYSFGTALPNSDVRAKTYGVLKMTLHDTSYDWEFVPVAGQTFTDRGTSSCHGAPSTAPPPPPPPPPGDSPIGLVGSTSDESSTTRSSITIQRPGGSAAGHVLVAAIASNADTTISAPNGWTAVRQDIISGAVRQSVYVKVAGSSEPASYTWTLGGSRRVAGGITAYTGVDTARPIDAVNASLNPVSTAVPAPGITTSVANAMVVQLVTVNAEGTLSPPAGMDEIWEAFSPNSSSARDVLMSSSHAAQGTAGPTGVRVATASLPGASIGVLLALRPAV
jgi:hypothetical protein